MKLLIEKESVDEAVRVEVATLVTVTRALAVLPLHWMPVLTF